MTGGEVGRALQGRLRRAGPWTGAVVAYLVYQAVQGYSGYFTALQGLMFLEALVGPFLLFWTIAFLGPVPWQWNGRRAALPQFARGVVQSVVFTEVTIFLLICVSWLLYRAAGRPFLWAAYMLTNLGLYAAVMVTIGSIQASREAESEAKLEARVEARTAQTRLLQSQLHPHVLFNALNGLAELIRKDPVRAEHSVKALSDLLRRLLVASEESRVELSSERSMVEDYLEIEALRLGDRLTLRWHWDRSVDGILVIPLLVQPLVENAIKHGISPQIEGGVLEVRATRQDEGLLLEVRNTGAGLKASDPLRQGIGMKNLASRLSLAYGDAARSSLESQGDWVVARIWISMAALRTSEASHARGPGR